MCEMERRLGGRRVACAEARACLYIYDIVSDFSTLLQAAYLSLSCTLCACARACINRKLKAIRYPRYFHLDV